MSLHRTSSIFTTSTVPTIIVNPSAMDNGNGEQRQLPNSNHHNIPYVPIFQKRRKNPVAAPQLPIKSAGGGGGGGSGGKSNRPSSSIYPPSNPTMMKAKRPRDEGAAFSRLSSSTSACPFQELQDGCVAETRLIRDGGGDGKGIVDGDNDDEVLVGDAEAAAFSKMYSVNESDDDDEADDGQGWAPPVDGDVDVDDDVNAAVNEASASLPLPTPFERLELALLLALAGDGMISSFNGVGGAGGEGIFAGRGGGLFIHPLASAAPFHHSPHPAGESVAADDANANADHLVLQTLATHDTLRSWVKGLDVPLPLQQAHNSHANARKSVSSASNQSFPSHQHRRPHQPSSQQHQQQKGKIYCLNKYNEIKDVAQHIYGLVAQQRGIELSQLYFEEGIDGRE